MELHRLVGVYVTNNLVLGDGIGMRLIVIVHLIGLYNRYVVRITTIKKSVDWELARGVLDIEVSAITTTKTLFSTTDGRTTDVPKTPPKGESKKTQRFKISSGGACVQCEDNQTDDYYTANGCIYTESRCAQDTIVTYYACNTATNPVVGESQRACIPQDVKPSSGTYYDTLEGCLNSGCAGFMWCEFGQSVNGVRFYESEGEAYSPIPMCVVVHL